MRIALVTAANVDVETLDDRGLADALIADHGVDVHQPRWDEPALSPADWASFDAVCLRSCWDYHRRYDEFVEWFTRADCAGVRWINPAAGVRWNSHKGYLLDLHREGVPIADLRLVPRGSACDLDALLRDTGWTEAIVKPAVSASAWRTFRIGAITPEVSRDRLAEPLTEPLTEALTELPTELLTAQLTELLADSDAIVQRFVPEIVDGEWSLVFVEDTLSHAVRKRPRPGDFRTQSELGAVATAETPSAALVATARQALRVASRFGAPSLTRIDLVETRDGPIVMEVELIEPMLFFGYAPGSAARAASALVARMRARSSAGR